MGTFRIRTRTKRKIKKALKKYGPAVGLLIFTIALLFRACEIETPYSLLGEAIPKTLSLDSFAIDNQITVVSQEQGVSKTRNFAKRLQISGYGRFFGGYGKYCNLYRSSVFLCGHRRRFHEIQKRKYPRGISGICRCGRRGGAYAHRFAGSAS